MSASDEDLKLIDDATQNLRSIDGQKSSPNERITSSMSRKIVCADPWIDLEIGPEAPIIFNCVVMVRKGTEFKSINKVDSFVVPYNLGFIPRTLGENDEEGIDVLVIMEEPVDYMWSLRVKAIGCMSIFDPTCGENEDKIIVVCVDDPKYQDCNDIKELPPNQFAELRRYVEDYKKNENPNAVFDDILPATKAHEAIQNSMNLFARDQERDQEENSED